MYIFNLYAKKTNPQNKPLSFRFDKLQKNKCLMRSIHVFGPQITIHSFSLHSILQFYKICAFQSCTPLLPNIEHSCDLLSGKVDSSFLMISLKWMLDSAGGKLDYYPAQ